MASLELESCTMVQLQLVTFQVALQLVTFQVALQLVTFQVELRFPCFPSCDLCILLRAFVLLLSFMLQSYTSQEGVELL